MKPEDESFEPVISERKIPIIKGESDVPPTKAVFDAEDIADLSPKERRDWQKWLKNLDFIKYILSIMLILYLIDLALAIWVPQSEVRLQEPFFEVLKTLLFTIAGYVFAKSSDN